MVALECLVIYDFVLKTLIKRLHFAILIYIARNTQFPSNFIMFTVTFLPSQFIFKQNNYSYSQPNRIGMGNKYLPMTNNGFGVPLLVVSEHKGGGSSRLI